MAHEIRQYQMCNRCILDTTDYSNIIFDEKGVCNICQTYDCLVSKTVLTGVEAEHKILEVIYAIKKSNKNNAPYDCLLGVSGGSDSSYLAYLAKKWGLNPLLLHVDNGWNSELAVKNIENIVKKLSFDLYTYVIDWEDMRDMHLSFLKASVVDIDLPYDNTFLATLYKVARKFRIKHVKGIDDYAMMKEIVHRRYKRLKEENKGFPDLIIIDGGKGHLGAAYEELLRLNAGHIPVIGIAKQEEKIYTLGSQEPLDINRDSEILHFIQSVRDEAHRFALKYHHALRRKFTF